MSAHVVESLRVLLTVIGAGLVFAGERHFAGGPSHWWLSGAGFGFLVLGIVFAILCYLGAKARGHSRELPSWGLAICWQAQVLGAFSLYCIYVKILGIRPAPDSFGTKVLMASWVLMGVFGIAMGIAVEWAQRSNGRGELSDPQRVRLAARGGLKVGMLAVIIASVNYIAVKKNVTWDLSYLKTTRPSESTIKILGGLTEDASVALFFPQGNEVLGQAKLYFGGLQAYGPRILVSFNDVEINPTSAEKYKVGRNGYVVVKSGDNSERFELGLTMESAKKNLKNIDMEFQKALLAATQKRKSIYFTRGHGEFAWTGEGDGLGLKSIKQLEKYLRSLNFTLKAFGVSDGSAKEVPADADAVVIVGGDTPFLPEEARVLQSYVEGGGKLFVLFDLDLPLGTTLTAGVRDASSDPLVKWLSHIGLTFEPRMLANLSNNYAGTKTEADVWFLFTNVFTSHESVTTLARNEQRAAILTFRSGFITTKQDVPGWTETDTVRSLSDTFVDENRNFKFDEGKEHREPKVIGAAVEQKSDQKSDQKAGASAKRGRVVAFADASIVSDPLVQNQGNLVYFVDSLRWLAGGAAPVGVPVSEEDVRIRHTSKEDAAWFYGTIVFVPGLVLLVGAFATRRARRAHVGGAA
jgi:ABC-type uncharacterized transport system